MSVKFFGQFLLEKKIISARQLIEATGYQESKNLRFGQYAVSRGLLGPEDVRRIHDEQKRSDMFFGEAAIKLGILKPEQVAEILTMQENDHLYIGEVLLEKGFITRAALERQLELFKRDQSGYLPGVIPIPRGVIDAETIRDIVNITQKMLRRIARLDVKIGEGFYGDKEPEMNFSIVSIALNGKPACEYVISCTFDAARAIASGIIGDGAESIVEETEDMIADAVREFANIVCGNVAAAAARRGMNLEITPPMELRGSSVLRGKKALFYPLLYAGGEITLILIEH